jgi:phospholipase/carboxylesterase
MDRIKQSLTSRRGPASEGLFDLRSAFAAASTHAAECAVFAPLHYERGYAYPLLVWLHGRGADEGQLMRVMPLVSLRNYVAVAPRGVRLSATAASDRGIRGWQQTPDQIQQAEQRVLESIESVRRRFHIARRRVFLAGFGCGGTMAFRVAMSHPTRFAGVLSLCGAFPRGVTPLGNLLEARRLPILLAVGRDSRQYPPSQVCEDLRLFHAAGLSATLRQYPCGHRLARQMLADMNCWIMDQITPAESSAKQADDYLSPEKD